MGDGGPDEVADRALIDGFLAEDPGLHPWPGDPGTILEVGDGETHWVLARRLEGFTFETISRGHRRITGTFGSARDARCFLLMRLGGEARDRRGLPGLESVRELAPEVTIVRDGRGHRLSWSGGSAQFASEYDATRFSWVAGAQPPDVAASYRAPDGRPLFLVELEVDDQGLPGALRSAGPVRRPTPAPTPPPDPEAAYELPTLERIAGEVDWTRQPVAGADVLAFGDGVVGRVVGYDGAAFVYASFVRDWRKTVATFSSEAAARRFLAVEVGGIGRTRQGLHVLRVHRAHPGAVLTKNPTQFDLTWAEGSATFGLGYTGHQQALVFSWCARAPLTEITATFADRTGAPLLDRRREDDHPPWHP